MSDDTDTPTEPKSYRPAKGKRIPMPGNQGDWPQEGRPINPLSGWENRLVADGDLVPMRDAKPGEASRKPATRRKSKTAVVAKTSDQSAPAADPPSDSAAADTDPSNTGGNQ